MKRKLWFLCISVAIVLSACVDDSHIAAPKPLTLEEVNEKGIVNGMVRVKLTPEAVENVSLTRTSGGAAQMGIAGLDELISSLGASRIERTFREGGKFEKRRREAGLHLWYDVYYDEPVASTRVCAEISKSRGIQLVEPVYEVELGEYRVVDPEKAQQLVADRQTRDAAEAGQPFNDPGLPHQWHYHNDGTIDNYFVPGADINLFKAWTIETGSPGVIVAIVDTGVDVDHEDLKANMWVNEVEKNGTPGEDDDNNGYIDDLYGWNFANKDAEIIAGTHGTHVAGTVAAVNNNGIGVSGVAGGDGSGNGVRLMSCQIGVSNVSGGYVSDAYAYAADNGAVICQNSWGHNSSVQELPQASREGIDYFIKYAGKDENGVQVGPIDGGIVIFAAGNSGTETVIMPGAYDEVLAVAGMGQNFQKGAYSTYGEWVDVTAPGGNYKTQPYTVYSTTPDNTYSFFEGTSMAAPHVSGVAALMVSKYAKEKISVTGQDIHRMIKLTTNNKGGEFYSVYNPNYKGKLGTGFVDAYHALVGGTDNGTPPVSPSKVEFECYNLQFYVKVTVTPNEIGYIPSRYEVFVSSRELSKEDFSHPSSDVTKVVLRTEVKKEQEVVQELITGLQPDTKYYVAVRPWNMTGGTIPPVFYETKTVNHKGPEEIADLWVRWVNNVMEFKWSVTCDPDDGKPAFYNLYYSTEDHHASASGISPNSQVEVLNVQDLKVGDEIVAVLRTLSADKSYFFAIQGVDIRTNVSPISYHQQYTGGNKAPQATSVALPPVTFSAKGESKTLDMSAYFTNDDLFGLSYEVQSTDNSLEYYVSNDLVTLILVKDTPGKGCFTITAKDYENLTASVSSDFTLGSQDTGAELTIYPNPFDKELNIVTRASVAHMEISVYSSMGARVHKEVLEGITAGVPSRIDLSRLNGGTYSLVLEYNGITERRNVIKK